MPPLLLQEPVFGIQSIKPLFAIFQGSSLFNIYLFLNNFPEVFLYKEKPI
jgi:hypothetical protein